VFILLALTLGGNSVPLSFISSLPPPLEVGPALKLGGVGERMVRAEPDRQTYFGAYLA